MAEKEIKIFYPQEWIAEYKQLGFPRIWLSDFPGFVDKSRGIYPPKPLPRKDKYCFADYALIYLLKKNKVAESITYHRTTVRRSKATKSHHPIMRRWMGDSNFEKLQQALWNAGFKDTSYKGEPDLFCWNADRGDWFFAEAKGPEDTVSEPQKKWFKVCRETLPDVRLEVYRLLPES